MISLGVDGAAASTRDIETVGDALKRLNNANFQKLNSQVSSISSHISGLKSTVGDFLKVGLASAAVGAFAAWIKSAADAGDAAGKLAQKTGVAVKDVAGLELAYQQAGLGSDVLTSSMAKLSKGIVSGSSTMEQLGIKSKNLDGTFKGNKQVLYELADGFAGMEDSAKKSAMAQEIFGKSGADMIPLLNGGSAALREMDEMAQKLGLTMTDEAAASAENFNDTMDLIKLGGQGVARGIASELLPTLSNLAGSFLTSMTSGDKLKGTADFLASGLKLLYTVGVGIVEVFSTVGKTIAAAGAQVVAILSGDFKQAAEIGRAWSADIGTSWTESAKAISDAWNNSGNTTVDAMVKIRRSGTQLGKDAAVVAKETAAAAKETREQSKLTAELSGVTATYVEDLKRLEAMRAKANLTDEQYVAMVTALIAKQPAAKKQMDDYAKAVEESQKGVAKFNADLAAFNKLINEPREKAIAEATKEAEANEALAATFGMTKAAIEAQELARLEEQLAQRVSLGLTLDEIEHLEKLVAVKKRSAAAVANIEDLKKQQETWVSIERTAHDTFVSIANGAKGTATRIRDTLKNVLFDWLYQMTVKKWIFNISAQVSGNGGMAGAAQSMMGSMGGGGEGGGMNIGSMMSMGKSIYGAIEGGFAGLSTGVADAVQGMMYQSGMTTQIAGNGAFASGAGAAAGAAAGIAGGVYGGRALSNGFSAFGGSGNSAVNTGTAIGAVVGSIIPVIGTALGALVGGLIGGAVNRMFGYKDKEYKDSGLRGTVGESGVTGENFANWTQKGGWFRSDRSGTDTNALDQEVVKQFTKGFDAVKAASVDFASVLGVSAEALNGYSKDFNLVLGKDMAANEKAVADFFSQMGDEMATKLVPNLAAFKREGEAASATLQRIAADYAIVDAVLGAIGQTFGAVGIESVTARERLIALSGGVEAFSAGVASFAQNYLTEAERLAPVAAAVSEAMAALGFASVDTHEEFKQLVMGIDKTTEAGAAQWVALMKLQGAFHQVHPAIVAVTEAVADQTSALEDQADVIDSLRAEADALLGNVDTALAALKRSIGVEKDKVTEAHRIAMKNLQQRIDTDTAAIGKHKQLTDALAVTMDQMRITALGTGARADAQAQIKAAIAAARASGVLPSMDSLKSALSVLGKDSSELFVTMQDYQRDFYRTLNDITDLNDLTEGALSIEEQMLEALIGQQEAAEQAYQAQMNMFNQMIFDAEEERNLLEGIDTKLKTIAEALAAFKLATGQAAANPIIASTAPITAAYQKYLGRAPDDEGFKWWQNQAAKGESIESIVNSIAQSNEAQLFNLYRDVLGRAPDAAGMKWWKDKLDTGTSLESVTSGFMNSEEYKKLHPFAVGTNYVPRTMPALVHEGERIIPRADNTELLERLRNPTANMDAMLAELRALREEQRLARLEIIELRMANSNENYHIAKYAQETSGFLDGAVNGETPILTEVAP